MMPSFMSSTLSLAFILCVVGVIIMIFVGVEPSDTLMNVISAVVGGYIGSRMPSSKTEEEHAKVEETKPVNIHDAVDTSDVG